MIEVKFKKLDKNAVIPEFKHPDDAGKDLFATSVMYNAKYDRYEYGLGFATEIPEGYYVEIVPRSTNTKKEAYIPNAPGTIDANYRGEWKVFFKLRTPRITNAAPYPLDEAIAQCMLKKREDWKFVETYGELSETDRGADGGLNRD